MSGTPPPNTSATGGYVVELPPSTPPSADSIAAALQTLTATLSGLPGTLVRPGWQPIPPTQPPADVTWASLGVARVEMDEYPVLLHDGATTWPGFTAPGVDRMQRHGTLTVVVTFYGPECEDIAGRMRDALYVPQNYEPLAPVQLKLRTVRDLARVPEFINQQWINRVDLHLEMRVQLDRTYPILNLDGAQIAVIADHSPITNDVPVTPTTPVQTP